MGRGLGLNNMSKEELRLAKRERDLASYHKNKHIKQKERALLLLTCENITCPCGGTYKDIIQNKNSHFLTQRHSLWDEEERLGVRDLICKKVKNTTTTEEAQKELDIIYVNNSKYKLAQKEGFLPSLVKHLNKKPDIVVEPPPPPPNSPKAKKVVKLKLKLKRPTNINDE
tara:strand:+ start:88 stop:597 length:510 start_codon:yes stop_codon:yes gene_type:complete